MSAYYNWLNSLYNTNRIEFGQWGSLRWLNQYEATGFQRQRDELTDKLETFFFKDTKPYYKGISPGCRICGQGKWSCLFITNKCNACCFYCPAAQNTDEVPSSQGMEFHTPEQYAEYIKHFDFKGVSFSGGEPLLYFDRTLEYLKAVKKIPNTPYIWLYTNGILADKEKMLRLADAGLDEIRFDIGATGFSLENVKKATGIIPNIAIEIPAVPEEKEVIKKLLPQMYDAGVTNLNLHHMRLTKHNVSNFMKRGYTIIPAERPLVLESELAALEIVDYASRNNSDIAINYCSFHFKNRFQKSGYRKMITRKLYPDAQITEQGYIRELVGDSVIYYAVVLSQHSADMCSGLNTIIEGVSYCYHKKKVLHINNLTSEYQKKIHDLINNEPDHAPEDEILFNIWRCEYIEKDLRGY